MTEYRYDSTSLANRLDTVLPPGRFDLPPGDDDPLVKAALLYATLPQPKMSPLAKGRVRVQVLQAYRQQMYAAPARPRLRSVMRWAVAAGLVVMLLMAGVTQVAMASLPGDILYPVKRAVERVELTLAPSRQAQASVHLKHAERRAQEALKLLDRGQWSPDLVRTALADLVAAAKDARAHTGMAASDRLQLEARTVQINTLLDSILIRAEQSGLVSQETLAPLVAEVRDTQASGSLLLPPAVTPTATPVPTMTPGATTAPSLTPTPTVPPTAPLAATQGPEVTDTAEIPVTIIIEGPVEAINDNVIMIHDIEIEIPPDDARLKIIRVGDILRLEGVSTKREGVFVITAASMVFVDVEVVVGDSGQVWRDEGNCSNPPPAWAPAHGWRRRCEGGSGGHGDEDDD